MILFEPAQSRKKVAWQAVYFGTWLAVTSVGLYLKPDPSGHGTHQELGLPPCPTALLLDRPCPGCGLTTSWTAVLHGQFRTAFSAHPLGPILYLCFTISAFLALYGFMNLRSLVLTSKEMNRIIGTCALLFFAFGLYRMAVTPHYRTAKEQAILAQNLGIPSAR